MKIALSNLAWEKYEDKNVLKLLNSYNIKGIELAPTKIWQSPTETNEKLIKKYRNYWNKNDIDIIATTSLLFGHPELTIFNDKTSRKKTLNYLTKMIYVSSILGASYMVFGSPKNRNTYYLPKKEVGLIASDFFFKLGDVAKKYDIFFGIEANPQLYGTDFINKTEDAIKLVEHVNHPNFLVHLDTGTMAINNEPYGSTLKKGLKLARHLHISEPGLKPIPQIGGTDHAKVSKILHQLDYNNWISIEMPLSPETADKFNLLENTLHYVANIYN